MDKPSPTNSTSPGLSLAALAVVALAVIYQIGRFMYIVYIAAGILFVALLIEFLRALSWRRFDRSINDFDFNKAKDDEQR